VSKEEPDHANLKDKLHVSLFRNSSERKSFEGKGNQDGNLQNRPYIAMAPSIRIINQIESQHRT
jgi:hypothetical protein